VQDCVTVKSGSSDIVAERLNCTNSHGITIGSVWYDDVTNVTYRDCVLHKLHAGPRIKGREQGNATISDIHFENILLDNVEQAVQIQMTYETPGSKVKNIGCTATGVTYKNITGTATSHGTHTAGSLSCLSTRPCEQIVMEDINITVTAATAATTATAAAESTEKKPPAPWECDSAHVASQGTVEPPLPASCTKDE
jgi:galacturan 1,4-alpha-galacturonidase